MRAAFRVCLMRRLLRPCSGFEHYEISAYGTAIAFAETLGLNEVIELLEDTLTEEKQADRKLTQISELEILREWSVENGARREDSSTFRTERKLERIVVQAR